MSDKKTIKNVKVFSINKAADAPKNKEDNSKQMAVDPFAQIYGDKGLVKPPYDMKVLLDITLFIQLVLVRKWMILQVLVLTLHLLKK
ncbi:hypothetical protein TU52_25285 [Bacillus cereus]|uniref:Uncharacterized protein n=1 Tax=Bacillus albus TaxID=2026189 RepID=A0A1J9UB99_9BACI|nr:hypothetical protein TU52_25285 [Bacillus cereus]OJD61301.1 hypothetical protein BAU25_15700 [Bacillus albus]